MKGSLRRRGENTWAIIIELPRDIDGKRKQKWHTFHGNKKDAEKELSRLAHEVNTGQYIEPQKMTVDEFLKNWQENYIKHNTSTRTQNSYRDTIRNYWSPTIGRMQIAQLKATHIQNALSGFYGRDSGRGAVISKTTVNYAYRVLKMALDKAVQWGVISVNPCMRLDAPRKDAPDTNALTMDEGNMLVKALEGTLLYIPVMIALNTGMRRNEILALQWSDVDLEAGRISITKSQKGIGRSNITTGETKTGRARTVEMTGSLVRSLRAHRAEQAQCKLLFAEKYNDSGYVCTMRDGSYMVGSYITNLFAKSLESISVKKVRFHDLRHTFITWMLMLGVNPKVIAEMTGHASVDMLLNKYAHVMPSMQKEAVRCLESVFEPSVCRGLANGTEKP